MSLKNGPSPPPRTWSLALTLTAYYSLSAFLIVLLATGYLYWAMVRNLDLEDDRLLADRISLLRTLLAHDPLDLAAIRQEVDESWQGGQRTQLFIRVQDSQGHVICESKGMDEHLPASAFPAAIDNPEVGANVRLKSGPLQRVMSAKLPSAQRGPQQWIVQVGMSRNEEEEMLDDYRENVLIVLAASLIICTAVGYQVTRRGIRPLDHITASVSGTQPTNLSERIDSTGLPTELQLLVDTFNAMLERLELAFNRLSSFTADIAHELRTPVNNMRGELDVALTKRRTIEEYEEIVGSSLEELGRLSRTIESLLFLARAENPQTQVEREQIDLGAELARIRDFFHATAEEAGVALEVDVAPHPPISLNRPLLQQAIGNLITNAIAHTSAGGKVLVRTSATPAEARIEVSDSGCGIAVEHLPHVFDRFYRIPASPGSQRPGIGLGLSIVKSIVELHGGHIAIISQVGAGTRVQLHFSTDAAKMTRS